jgi:23S rRNA (guanine745-N1)-methyltransferase
VNTSPFSIYTDAYATRIARLQCPLCQSPLAVNTQGLSCGNRHQFDRAKEGYFNLLPVHKKNSLEPGDAKTQLQARRDFLRAGYFDNLLTHINALIPTKARSLVDIGCGEGYFTQGIAAAHGHADIYGIDIAKSGVRLASKQADKTTLYAVASAFDLPFQTGAIDVITRIFAPSKDHELNRVMSAQGILLIAAPGPDHLRGVREPTSLLQSHKGFGW